jgi:hypothetical protein
MSHGKAHLVQVRVKKPIDPGEQIVIKTNQPEIGGSGLVQELMDEPGQQYQKQSEISEKYSLISKTAPT